MRKHLNFITTIHSIVNYNIMTQFNNNNNSSNNNNKIKIKINNSKMYTRME